MQHYQQSVEEFYEYSNRYTLVNCDICGDRVPARSVHFMQSFKHKDTELLVCSYCVGKQNKGAD